ncbi:MAG TPA: NADP-dependent oxidoreductase [Polyangiaceae bacterium]
MKAVLLTGYGDVDKLEFAEVAEPRPGRGEVKVRVASTSVNPVDYKLRRGDLRAMYTLELPAILGRDVAGEVIEVGPGVKELDVGDRVLGLVQHGYAQMAVAHEEAFAKLPPEIEEAEAAVLPLVGLTGAQLIEEAVVPQPGDLVLVTGAVGSVGRVAVFAAKRCGARVIAGVRGSQRAQAEALDVERVIALDDPKDVLGLPPLDCIADTVNGKVLESVLTKLKPGGVLGSVLGEPKAAHDLDVTVHAIQVHPDAKRLAELAEAMAHGDLELPIGKRYPLHEVRAAQRAAEQHASGKVLLLVE